MGSVKDVKIDEEPTDEEMGTGELQFSDRFSVFDWGPMPCKIPYKGEVLARMGALNLRILEEEGFNTHFLDLFSPRKIKIELANVLNLDTQDYLDLADWDNFLIPLEVIVRHAIPEESSVRARYNPDHFGLSGWSKWPEEMIRLENPFLEFSTKLEARDRYLSGKEALEISGLTIKKFERLEEKAKKANKVLNQYAKNIGFQHLDGKMEFIYDNGKIKIADVAYTFDEDRFLYQGKQVSKEILRGWYHQHDSQWYTEILEKKEKHGRRWKKFVSSTPTSLDSRTKKCVSEIYRAGANLWIDDDFYSVPPLGDLL